MELEWVALWNSAWNSVSLARSQAKKMREAVRAFEEKICLCPCLHGQAIGC